MKKCLLGHSCYFTAGCDGPVHFNRSFTVARIFEAYELMPQYRYYISGGTYKPTAMVGLDHDITLDSPHWKPIGSDQERLKIWVQRMCEQPGAEFNVEPNGAVILDDQGRQIGIWYSVWATPLLKIKSYKVIEISEPMTVFPESNRNRGNT